ncbi:MAG: RNase adapter RapZ [Nitriliruptorales bacterium]
MTDVATDHVGAPPSGGTHQVIVITGMSGAGRTEAAKVLEDLGFYVVDNLPPQLVGRVVELASRTDSTVDRIAVVADVRVREFFGELVSALEELRELHPDVRIVFLEAEDDVLVRRYEASRRRHPLAQEGTESIVDGISRERRMLEEVRGMADLVVDTTDINVHELRERLVETFGTPESAAMRVNVISFGYKYGLPRDADIVMDVRFLPNPHWIEGLREQTGLDPDVREYLNAQPETGPFLARFRALLDTVVPGYIGEGKRYLTIAIGCTGGKHRSVAIGSEIASHLEGTTRLPVHVDHRDVGRE